MARATPILSSSIHPTMGDLHLIFPTILNILYDAINSEIQIKSQIAQRMYKKLNDYWAILQNCCNISVVMDPSINYQHSIMQQHQLYVIFCIVLCTVFK